MIRAVFFMMAIKIILVLGIVFLLLEYMTPKPACWSKLEAPADLMSAELNKTYVVSVSQNGSYLLVNDNNMRYQVPLDTEEQIAKLDGNLCCTTFLDHSFLCTSELNNTHWWSTLNKQDPFDFCLNRGSAYASIITQLVAVLAFHLSHVWFLSWRCFNNLDPIDLVPAFFSFCAFTSILVIEVSMHYGWYNYWTGNKYVVPSEPINHDLMVRLLGIGLLLVLLDWIMFFMGYDYAQEARATAANEEESVVIFNQVNPVNSVLTNADIPNIIFSTNQARSSDLPSDNSLSSSVPESVTLSMGVPSISLLSTTRITSDMDHRN